jgi:hypothetical protein
MSVSAAYASNITVTEILTNNVDYASASNKDIVYNGLNYSVTIDGGTTVPATAVAAFPQALIAGAATIDLRALVGTNGVAVDGNGLKVQMAKFRNKSTNANSITLTFGASNGYLLFGSGWQIILLPGQEFMAYLKDQAPDIDATHKTIDITGTLAQVLECILVLG